ncbi:MAG TPA: NAD(P)-binding protein, partial [Longimicrobium sp.]|nr:NAD(P)-binding protein [Longimicrobium sp.]
MPPLDGGGMELDVAIVGAGVSGLYSGWRLLTGEAAQPWGQGGRPRTAIFEGGRRIGGRLFSVTDIPGLPNVVGELGGMRFMEHQGIVNSLVDRFKLAPVDFPMGDEGANLFY